MAARHSTLHVGKHQGEQDITIRQHQGPFHKGMNAAKLFAGGGYDISRSMKWGINAKVVPPPPPPVSLEVLLQDSSTVRY